MVAITKHKLSLRFSDHSSKKSIMTFSNKSTCGWTKIAFLLAYVGERLMKLTPPLPEKGSGKTICGPEKSTI